MDTKHPNMSFRFIIEKMGSREKFAKVFTKAPVTTYKTALDKPVPDKIQRIFDEFRPEWVKEWRTRCKEAQ